MTAALSLEQVRAIAPAAFADHADSKMSDRYGFVNTSHLLQEFGAHGWLPASVKQDNPRSRDPGFIRHAVALRHQDTQVDGEYAPQILLVNSHNGQTKLRLYAGVYRFVCSNGLVVGDTKFKMDLAHNARLPAAVEQYVGDLMGKLGDLHTTIESWKKVVLSSERQEDFAARAIKLRFDEKAGAYTTDSVLQTKREEDEGRSLWRTFNTIQEHTVGGGMHGINATGRRVASRALNGIRQDTTYNQALWNLAAEYV